MAKYTEMAKGVLTNVGGIENITFVEHCATRLRIHYKSKNKVNVEALKTVDRVGKELHVLFECLRKQMCGNLYADHSGYDYRRFDPGC